MLEAGSGLLLGLPLAAGSGMLLLGLSGGWPALLSGRLAQGSLLLCALLSFQIFSGMEAFLAAAFLLTMAIIADAFLDLISPAPFRPISSSQGSVPLSSPELNGSVMGGIKSSTPSAAVGRIINQAEQAASQADADWLRTRKLEDQSGLNRTSYRS